MKIRRLATVSAATAILVAAPCVAALADVGDGQEACNVYEICFARNSDSLRYQRHFYYGDSDHGNNNWYDNTNDTYTSTSIEDDVNRLKNRDGSCDVKVIDWNGALPSVSQTIANDGYWHTLNSSVQNQNNEHQRVNC